MANYITFEDVTTNKGKIVPVINVISIEALEDGTMYVTTKENGYYTTEVNFGK